MSACGRYHPGEVVNGMVESGNFQGDRRGTEYQSGEKRKG